jgi:hypothetical protein
VFAQDYVMLDPRVWSKPFVGVLIAAVPWESLESYVGEKERDRLDHILTLLCLAAVGRWMYVERYGDEATKIKYWHGALWIVSVTLVVSALSTLLVRGLGIVDLIYGIVSCVPFAVALLYRQKVRDEKDEKQAVQQQGVEQQEEQHVNKDKVEATATEIQDGHQVLNKTPFDDTEWQFMTIASKLNSFVDQETLKTMDGLNGGPTVGQSGRPAIVDDSVWFEKECRNSRATILQ